jgi:hypothetical protein
MKLDEYVDALDPGEDAARLLSEPGAWENPAQRDLAPSKMSIIYRAVEGDRLYAHHPYLVRYKGEYWAMWSAGFKDEDRSGQIIRYSRSADGHDWAPAETLTEPTLARTGVATCIARGIFVNLGRLTALVYERDPKEADAVVSRSRLKRYFWNGIRWHFDRVILEDALNNYPPRPVGDRLFMTLRRNGRKMHTALSEDLFGDAWDVSILPGVPPEHPMSEPSWYVDPDGVVHLIFRDAGWGGLLFRSLSHDDGKTWTPPVKTDYPDATSKNFSQRLSNGLYYLINNPSQCPRPRVTAESRDPLGIAFSPTGWSFSHPRLLRAGAPARRFEGHSKDIGFSYPHALEHGDSLWVIYSTNKEDIEISQFELKDLCRGVML